MLVLRMGLMLGAAAFLAVGALSFQAGYAPDVALLRALGAFCVLGMLGYAGELIVATAPPAPVARPAALASADAAAPRVLEAVPVQSSGVAQANAEAARAGADVADDAALRAA